MSRLKKFFFKFVVFVLFSQTGAWAGTLNIPSTDFSQDEFKNISKELGLALSYIPASPAEPLGITGFDIGLEVTAATISNKNTFWTAVSPGAPSLLPLPKIHIQKGLPLGIDVGAVYASVSELDLSVIGAEIKYALMAGSVALPAVAVRGAFTQLQGVDTLDLNTLSADLSVSKGFALITPYAGAGIVKVTASEKTDLPLEEEKQDLSKAFVGVKISLAVINFVAEADFADIPLYTLRLNIGF